MVEQESHRVMNRARLDRMVVIEYDDELNAKLSDVVDERNQNRVCSSGMGALDQCFGTSADVAIYVTYRGHKMGQEASRVVVALVQRQPNHPQIVVRHLDAA
ncbi:hypothetical protein [Arthrobacter sp. D3-16]